MKHSRTVKSILFTLFILLGFAAYREFLQDNILAYVGQQHIWDSRRFIAFLIICALSLFLLFMAIRNELKEKEILGGLGKTSYLPIWLNQVLAISLIFLPALMKWFVPLPKTINLGFWTCLFLMYCTALLSLWLTGNDNLSPGEQLLRISSLWLAGGAAYAACAKLVYVTSYPFSLYWSEGNRFFDYSTLFGSFRYIIPDGNPIYSFISWGMQLPWALPFLLPNLSITAFRFWYQLMWIFPPFLFGITAYRTFNRHQANRSNAFTFGLWAFVFLDQGPIYAPLLFSGMVMMIALRYRLFPAILGVFFAAFYAFQSRWTWSFAPGLWAGMAALLILEKPSFHKEKIKELFRPVTLGLAGLFGGRILPETLPRLTTWFNVVSTWVIALFTNYSPTAHPPVEIIPTTPAAVDVLPDVVSSASTNINVLPNIISSATRQPLLWERLYPNSTYPPGILLGIAWASLPIIILLLIFVIKKIWQPNWLQTASILLISGAFLAVGLTASVKIGGGSNLHNLDMFLVTLVIVAAAALTNFKPHDNLPHTAMFWVSALTALMMVIPITYALRASEKPHLPKKAAAEEALAVIREKISETAPSDSILFIDHRQLLTFNLVPQVPLVDDYEKKKLMDEAMGSDIQYFELFFEDIGSKRFALIINEPLNVIFRGEDFSFGEENDTYVKWVTLPLTCSYEPIYTNFETGVELLVPRDAPPEEFQQLCKKYYQHPPDVQ